MRTKLSLKLEDLSVASFSTSPEQKARGTVFGEQCTCYTNCTCPGCPTCDNTCQATCAYTCDDATCANTCGNTCDDYTCAGCNTAGEETCQFRCTETAQYTYCNGIECY